jgi:uncharacterized membrane protein YfcA|tara:strand:- start:1605 stop:2051 length:447 start_codon:yes stop_codon:yes gene_type:complete
MFGLPVEAISMLGSTALGGVMKMWSQSQADKAEQHKMMLQANQQVQEGIDSARAYQNPNAAWIRRFIVVTAMLAGIGIVFMAPLLNQVTNIPVEVTHGSKFLFGIFDSTHTVTEYLTLEGWVTPEWLPVSIMNIIGFYFGSAAMTRNK